MIILEAGQTSQGSGSKLSDDPTSAEQSSELRVQPQIVQLLEEWYISAQTTELCWHGRKRNNWTVRTASGISATGYALCLLPVFKALADEFDPVKADSWVADDWNEDSQGEPMLSKLCFCDSIFQLAEIWIGSSQEEDYSRFLERLLAEVTEIIDDDEGHEQRCFKKWFRVFRAHDLILTNEMRRFHVSRKSQRWQPQRLRRHSAISIQAAARGRNGRKIASRRAMAVKMIQASSRGLQVRKETHTRRSAILALQAHLRAQLCRRILLKRKAARVEELLATPPLPPALDEAWEHKLAPRFSTPNIRQPARYLDHLDQQKVKEHEEQLMRKIHDKAARVARRIQSAPHLPGFDIYATHGSHVAMRKASLCSLPASVTPNGTTDRALRSISGHLALNDPMDRTVETRPQTQIGNPGDRRLKRLLPVVTTPSGFTLPVSVTVPPRTAVSVRKFSLVGDDIQRSQMRPQDAGESRRLRSRGTKSHGVLPQLTVSPQRSMYKFAGFANADADVLVLGLG